MTRLLRPVRPRTTPATAGTPAMPGITRAWKNTSERFGERNARIGSERGGNGQTSNGASGPVQSNGKGEQLAKESPELQPQKVEYLQFPQPRPSLQTGLHKTPSSGGVQNATSRCDLPSPAVAVRNLVEQAQFAHLCTVRDDDGQS